MAFNRDADLAMNEITTDEVTTDEITTDEIAWRRFGRDHAKPCKNPDTLTCALWECQKANECQADAFDAMVMEIFANDSQ